MRTDLIREINYIKMCENIKPNFSALARTYKTSRNTVKKYYYAKEEATDHKRVYRSIFDSYEDFIRERIKAVPECTYAALLMVLKAEYPELAGAKYNTLTAFCRRKKLSISKEQKAHVLYETPMGHQLQVDWKEDITVHTKDGKELFFNIFSATLGASRLHRFVYTVGKTRGDFFRCLNQVFRELGGAVDEILTDNMAPLVDISDPKKGRRKYPEVLQWEKDADIKIRLCKPRSPETKGKVEVSNKFVDRIAAFDGLLVDETDLKAKIKDIEKEANEKDNSRIGMPPISLFRMKEKDSLRPLPDMKLLETYEKADESRKVPSSLLVEFRGRDYSVPAQYIGLVVRISCEGNDVVINYNGKEIARHKISDKKINYLLPHYTEGLAQSIGNGIPDDELEKMAERNLELFGI